MKSYLAEREFAMRNKRLYFGTLVFTFVLAAGLIFGNKAVVRAAEATPAQTTGTTPVAPKESNYDRWMNICTTMGKNMTRYHFHYSRYSNAKSYRKAVKKQRTSNCAAFVSWCLQEYGVLRPGEMIYARESGRVNKNYRSWRGKVRIIPVYRKPKNAASFLKPGDVVLWKNIVHTNIYAGRNSKGEMIWIDGGSMATTRSGNEYYKSADKKKVFNYLNKHTISYVIRIKDL